MLDRLKLGDRTAELLSQLGILQRGIVGALRHADGQRRDGNPAAVQNLQAVDEAFAALAQKLRLRQPAVVENHFAGGAGAQAELVLLLAGAKSGRAFLDDECGDAMLRGRSVGHRHGHADIRVVRVGGECLRAVQHPAAALQRRGGARARRVRAGLRFGQRPAADPLARRQLRQIPLPLLIGAHLENVVRAQRSVRGQMIPTDPSTRDSSSMMMEYSM